jgi:hypothetical protein
MSEARTHRNARARLSREPVVTMRRLFRTYGTLQRYGKNFLDLQRCIQLNCISMDAKEYERIKEDIHREVEEAQKKAKARLDALEIVWDMERGKQPRVELLDSTTWADMVRKVLPTLPETFTRYEMEQAVVTQFPGAKDKMRKNSLGGILTRMEAREQIEVVERGSGPRPAKYRLIKRD